MKHAKKIHVGVDLSLTKKASVVVGRHGTWGEQGKYHVVRKYLPRKQVERVRDALPETLKPFLMGVNFSEIRLLAPHIHLEEQCVINFYLATHGEITSFWEGEIERDDRESNDNGNGYVNVNPEKLICTESFVADVGDVWLLNTRQPHSVSVASERGLSICGPAANSDDVRLIVQAYIDFPYDQAAACFE